MDALAFPETYYLQTSAPPAATQKFHDRATFRAHEPRIRMRACVDAHVEVSHRSALNSLIVAAAAPRLVLVKKWGKAHGRNGDVGPINGS